MKWFERLDKKMQDRVLELQSKRENALYEAFVLDGNHAKARNPTPEVILPPSPAAELGEETP